MTREETDSGIEAGLANFFHPPPSLVLSCQARGQRPSKRVCYVDHVKDDGSYFSRASTGLAWYGCISLAASASPALRGIAWICTKRIYRRPTPPFAMQDACESSGSRLTLTPRRRPD